MAQETRFSALHLNCQLKRQTELRHCCAYVLISFPSVQDEVRSRCTVSPSQPGSCYFSQHALCSWQVGLLAVPATQPVFFVPLFLGTLFLLLWIPPPPCLLLPKHPYCKRLFFLQKPSFKKLCLSWRPPQGPFLHWVVSGSFCAAPTKPCSHRQGTVLTSFAGSLLFWLDSVLLEGSNQNLFHNGISKSVSLNFNASQVLHLFDRWIKWEQGTHTSRSQPLLITSPLGDQSPFPATQFLIFVFFFQQSRRESNRIKQWESTDFHPDLI